MRKKPLKKTYPVRAADVPVTQGMLYEVRDELKAEIRGHEKRFSSIDSRFDSLEARMDSRFEKMSAEMHSMKLLFEEQNARNNIVLDGLTNLFARQERLEDAILNLK